LDISLTQTGSEPIHVTLFEQNIPEAFLIPSMALMRVAA